MRTHKAFMCSQKPQSGVNEEDRHKGNSCGLQSVFCRGKNGSRDPREDLYAIAKQEVKPCDFQCNELDMDGE